MYYKLIVVLFFSYFPIKCRLKIGFDGEGEVGGGKTLGERERERAMAMKPLVNAFSLLELDAEDDQIPALSTSSKDDATVSYPSPTGSLLT